MLPAAAPTPTLSVPMTTSPSQQRFQAPTGTRDFYPAELARLRYIQDAWRRTSINHGFEEIDGPTFEHLELYTVKSGEGIVSELFSFERFGGEKKFALRPEFTPTLARLYATKAASLPKPTRWFWQQNCFRAERPQRGRLREFCQWNVDLIGEDGVEADADVIACAVDCLRSLGLTSRDLSVRFNNRFAIGRLLIAVGVQESLVEKAMALLDRRGKIPDGELVAKARELGFDINRYNDYVAAHEAFLNDGGASGHGLLEDMRPMMDAMQALRTALAHRDIDPSWCRADFGIVRGLAYYTGTVFEIIVDGERAVAGGGRYDKLIEMFGGPPTPAVGFGMGDVVLSLVLQDKGLFPSDDDIADRLGLRPDVFVISNGTPEADAKLVPMIAELRRAGLHARRSYKATRNVGKLLGDATRARARHALIIESGETGQLKNLTTQDQRTIALTDVVAAMKAVGGSGS